jgi:N-acetylglucosaminyl-diphospho-decaprenol L-rhamnosyltransferase
MRLTVSIVNFKTPHLVIETISSLKRFPPSDIALDIAVVDNGSEDNSLSLIGAAHPDIRLIDAEANLGFAGGNNLVMRDNTSDYLLLLNSDALIEQGTLDKLIEVLNSNSRVGAVGARIVNVSDGADQDYPCRFPSLFGMLVRATRGPEYPAAGKKDPVALERLHGAGMLIRGELLQTVGLLDDGFFMYDEDVDWCTRARAQGWDLWLVPEARVLHYGGASSKRAPSSQRRSLEASETALRMRYELRRSRYRLYRKHRSLLETIMLKALTDAVMFGQSFLMMTYWLIWPKRRSSLGAVIENNFRIMGLNPFAKNYIDHVV